VIFERVQECDHEPVALFFFCGGGPRGQRVVAVDSKANGVLAMGHCRSLKFAGKLTQQRIREDEERYEAY
jgi:hypothetical protein